MPNHDLGNPLRVVLDLALRVRPMNALVWRAIHGLYYGEASSFVDDVFDYTFFMDGSRRASAVADRLGVELATAQQSFVLPFDFGERDRSIAALADLVGRARRAARRARLTTLMLDVMYVPGEVRDRVSLVPDDPGLVVTIALDASPPAQRARVERYLEDLTHEVALASGRVDLGKLVVARDEDLGTMHGRSLSRFLALKRRIDPRKTLRNAFFERLERIGLAFEGANGHAHNSSPSTS